MEALPGPVMNNTRCMPLRASSSTTYWTMGLRPTGSISLGCDLVAGKSRVPSPATGTTAISISLMSLFSTLSFFRRLDRAELTEQQQVVHDFQPAGQEERRAEQRRDAQHE